MTLLVRKKYFFGGIIVGAFSKPTGIVKLEKKYYCGYYRKGKSLKKLLGKKY
jgi:hypothetical protein